jgi:hypothetical protein
LSGDHLGRYCEYTYIEIKKLEREKKEEIINMTANYKLQIK